MATDQASVGALGALPKHALALLEVLSLLDADTIQEEILTAGAKKVELAHYPGEKTEYLESRAELLRSSLITADLDRHQIRIHPLVQAAVRHRMSPGQTLDVFETTVTLLLEL